MSIIEISNAERDERLERARRRSFSLDVDDAGARLGRVNGAYGLAKVHWMQEQLGLEPDATWVATPDSTVTRNLDRWRSGFGYGGVFEWSGRFMPLELKPNCCGMLVAGLREPPRVEALRDTVHHLSETSLDVDGVSCQWDMHRGNHFLNLYEVGDPDVTAGFRWVAIMHSSGSELRGPNPRGPGLYLGSQRTGGSLAEMAEAMNTPFGLAVLVREGHADLYLDYVEAVDRFAKVRRETYAREIFGREVEILFDETHQGLVAPGRMVLGCYDAAGRLSWVPLTLRADLPAYLIAPGEIYAESILEAEGMLERAREEGCLDRVRRAGVLPHGGGYAYPELDGRDLEVDDPGPENRRRFRAGTDGEWFADVRDLAFGYRGLEVLRRLEALGSGRSVATLEIVARLDGPG